jgi:hypothetical protein
MEVMAGVYLRGVCLTLICINEKKICGERVLFDCFSVEFAKYGSASMVTHILKCWVIDLSSQKFTGVLDKLLLHPSSDSDSV